MKLRLTGKTYAIKDSIKLHGGTYEPDTKTWLIDAKEWAVITSRTNSRHIARLAESVQATPAQD